VSGASYARVAATFGAPSDGASSNTAAIEFAQATTEWGTVGWIGILDASTSGNLLYHSPLDAAKLIEIGDVFKIAIGNLTVTFA
jgi:hypothetical protein